MRIVLAVVATVLAPFWVWAQDGSGACLISRDEFATLSGRSAYTDPESMPWGSGAVCGYDGGQIILFSGETAMANLEHLLDSFGAGGNRVPVPDLGAEAYAFFVEAENKYQDHGTFVAFSAGPHAVGVTVYADDGQPAETALPKAVTVAKAVHAALP
ncbi:hypothetical protein [Mesorhizobium sp.]|uniref:hypothetical protein n=1 Tax=Mesorhizobium sp. TaxID=1871066 RepID=UPI000FEA391B|nr:hypothetical protein [Mesorhizobium sp.]RWK35129.1 MAG: hypothetical protein EOR46_28040 [Mesorhizobium sp.]RWK66750.1 MAG: hypothetical protein EOR54_22680 [Mesorhizobium sp.]RWK74672.1 MAG: hypothetical protein EOR50_19145 [Mesorhizobium sp.]RWK83787.1 MAG: hypothetical protein EOR51_06195 [Mesorhizobium sp.]RWL00387.1 MAG: hypothetical protein EOR55_29225 [Mesorhizobium sp.]